jgi:hypothetical protein
MPSSLFPLWRRQLNRCLGHGPWRVTPFAEVARERTDPRRHGVHRPEHFTGIVGEEPGTAQLYTAPQALLGQDPARELLGGEPRYREQGLACAEPKRLFSLTDAGIAGTDGVVYCPRTRQAVAESMRNWMTPVNAHPLLGAIGLPPAQPLPGISLSLATLDGQGFYHFLHESLPRLWLARAQLAAVDHVLVGGEADDIRAGWLELAGVPRPKIVWLGGLAHYRCEQLLFASLPMLDYQPTPWNLQALRRLLSPEPGSPTRWLWVSRSDARVRHLAWEDEILSHFPKFEKVVLSAMGPSAQARLFATAAVVAGPHGAGLAQLAFCPPGGRLVELFPPGHRQPIYARLAQTAGLTAAWAMVDFDRPTERDRLISSLRAFLPSSPPNP